MHRLICLLALAAALCLQTGCNDIIDAVDGYGTTHALDEVYYETSDWWFTPDYDSYYETDYVAEEWAADDYWVEDESWLVDGEWYYDEYTGDWCMYDAYYDTWYCDDGYYYDAGYDEGWYYDEYRDDWCYYDAYYDAWYCDSEHYDDEYWWP